MSIIGLVSAIVLLVILIIYIIAPLLSRQNAGEGSFRSKQRERALAYYERVLRNLRDLDDDLATGKIMQAEYDLERERWMQRGVELLKMLEQLDHAHNIVENLDDRSNDADIDAAIEQAISEVQEQAIKEEI